MKTYLAILTTFAIVAVTVGGTWLSREPASALDATLKIVHIRVGQGDATLILGPEQTGGTRTSVLIDAGDIPFGGDRNGGRIVAAVLGKNGVTSLDFFIATHYDADHIGGAVGGGADSRDKTPGCSVPSLSDVT